MKLRHFFYKVNEEIYEAKKLVKKQGPVVQPQSKAGDGITTQGKEKKEEEITREQIQKFNSWTPGEQSYVLKTSKKTNGVYWRAFKQNKIKPKEMKKGEKETPPKEGGAEGEVDHGAHAKLIGNKEFTNILQQNVDSKTKSAHFDNMLSRMKPDEKMAFLEKFHASYGEGTAPDWAAEIYKKHYQVSKSEGEGEGKPAGPDIEKHIVKGTHKDVADALRVYAKTGKKPKNLNPNQMKDFEKRMGSYEGEKKLKEKETKEKEEKEKELSGRQKRLLDILESKGGMAREAIDIIDGKAKKGAYDGTEKAPGNRSSFINETSIGTCLSYLNKDPKMSVAKLYENLWKEIKDSDVVDKNGDELSQKAAYAAAISAKAEHRRIQRIMKEDKLNPKKTTVSHVWGSKTSLQNTVDFLEKLGVKEVNGVPFEKYKSVILGGGAGDNPTDTMSVLIDHSKKPPRVVILHTSNKTSTSDIQGNSSPKANMEKMLAMAEEDMKNGKITEEDYNKYKAATQKAMKRLTEKQAEIEGVISKEYDKLFQRALKPKEREKLIDEIKKASTGDEPAKYWNSIVKRYYKGDKKIKERAFNSKTGAYKPPLTPEEEKRVVLDFVNEMKSSVTDDTIEISKEMGKIASRIAPFDEKALAAKYQEQHELQNDVRKEMNKALKGKGDEYWSKLFISRFHGDIVSGHDAGGVPAKYFELNMGKNNSRIKYDEQGNVWERKMVTVKEKGKEKQVERFVRTVNGKEESRTITGLTDGDIATVGNSETFSHCLGLKTEKDKKELWKHIKVSEVKCSNTEDDDDADSEGKKVKGPSASGYANIYGIDREGKEFFIGVQTLRPKGGKGSQVQDTIQFHKDFQTCLQRQSHEASKLVKEDFDYIVQIAVEYIRRKDDLILD